MSMLQGQLMDEVVPLQARKAEELAWINLAPSRHFIACEDRGRRCAMCHKIILAGERYFGSRTIDYTTVARFHPDCGERYAEMTYI